MQSQITQQEEVLYHFIINLINTAQHSHTMLIQLFRN